MPNSLQSKSSKVLEPVVITSKRQSKRCLASEDLPRSSLKSITFLDQVIPGKGPFVDIGIFLLKLAALEIVRRAKAPFVWQGLQSLQIFCFLPLKWIQRCPPFKSLVNCMQTLSRPILVLSIATTICDALYIKETTKSSDDRDTHNFSQLQSEPSASQSVPEPRISNEASENSASDKWMIKLYEELDKQGLTLPERINDDELRRFYTAANGEFPTFLLSIKKTVRWRQSYKLLSPQELEVWSHLVFWHGHDVKLRPCLMIRLGLACAQLTANNKASFAQAVVSQVEYGVLHLIDTKDTQIIVLMDCEKLSPFRFPMQIMRSIAILLQDHYPNRLGCLFVLRLPPVARVIIQTLTQVLKPVTRKKLRIIGEKECKKVLSENLQTIPSFLGGQCSCSKCSAVTVRSTNEEPTEVEESSERSNDEDLSSLGPYDVDTNVHVSCDQVLRTAIIGVLMIWIFIAFVVVFYDP